jgi:hypothetical protein
MADEAMERIYAGNLLFCPMNVKSLNAGVAQVHAQVHAGFAGKQKPWPGLIENRKCTIEIRGRIG